MPFLWLLFAAFWFWVSYRLVFPKRHVAYPAAPRRIVVARRIPSPPPPLLPPLR